MYIVKYGDEYLHDPRVNNCVLLDLSLDCEENSCGYCDFTIHSNHPMYDKLKERDADHLIQVYDDDILLFSGFIYELGKEFYLDGHVKCKGELDFLSESIVRPYSTLQRGYGNKAPTGLDQYFNWLIEQHNNQVSSNKQFVIGINEGSNLDDNNYIFRENDSYPTTISELSDKLLNNVNAGGFVRTRHENGVRYIDYLSAWNDVNTQILDFGKNLTDYTQTDDASSIATYIIPTGARMGDTTYDYNNGFFPTTDTVYNPEKEYYTYDSENECFMTCNNLTAFVSGTQYYEYDEYSDEKDRYLTIEGVDPGAGEADFIVSGDMVYCESAVAKYGWIGTTYSNVDLYYKEHLVTKSILALKEYVSPKRTIEIKAVDMHFINSDIKPIRIGEYVRVRSVPHKLDSYFLCKSIDLDLNNPENSLYTLGTTFDTLTGQQNKKINELNDKVLKQYETAKKLSDNEKINAQVANSAQNGVAVTQALLAQQDIAICDLYELLLGGE